MPVATGAYREGIGAGGQGEFLNSIGSAGYGITVYVVPVEYGVGYSAGSCQFRCQGNLSVRIQANISAGQRAGEFNGCQLGFRNGGENREGNWGAVRVSGFVEG